jgi:hypothetical protein
MPTFFRPKSSLVDRCVADVLVTRVDGLPPAHCLVSVMLRRGNSVATTQQVDIPVFTVGKLRSSYSSATAGCHSQPGGNVQP